ncbi:fibroblast growth factor receptor 2-like [Planococcus citri]|uniref:fibroblast growth factor receptor 2-like n=1 Tax=Planococcus citri TaxID=170843 RepID=UPI0031F73CA4
MQGVHRIISQVHPNGNNYRAKNGSCSLSNSYAVIRDVDIKRLSTTTATPTTTKTTPTTLKTTETTSKATPTTTKATTNSTTIDNPSTSTTSSTTRSNPTNSSSITFNATYYSKYFRVYIKLMEAYTYDFDDHSSSIFQEYERKVTTGVKEIFSMPDFARARLVAILSTFDISQSRAVVDLEFSDVVSETHVGDTLSGQLASYKKIGSLTASPEKPFVINFRQNLPFRCSPTEIPCKNSSKCVPSSGRCDKNATCLDGSDEEECPGADRCTDENDKFSCPHSGGILVCASVKCDGKKDCPGGEDEPPTCDKTPGQESSQPTFGKDDMIMKISVTALGMILIIGVICGILFFCKYKREMRQKDTQIAEMTQLVKKIVVKKQINIDDDFPDVLNMPVVSIERLKSGKVKNGMVSVGEYEMSLDESWEYPRQNLHLGETLGEGEFGKVVQAEARNIWERGNGIVTVAVKMLKDDHMDSDMIDLVSEMELMKLLGSHQNILRLLGCCSQGGPLLVITEYAQNGNLKNCLQKHLHHSIKMEESTLLTYARQIAQGMVYLSSIKCIHRDLAARNILVTAQFTMKIADFGLARDVRHTEYYKKTSNGRLPIKWMAPEALFHNKYTTQSDVWSYGILFWEIITLGDNPYPSIEDFTGLRNALMQNYRMEKPPNASTNVYNLMMDCWNFEPEDRPNFLSIVERLEELLTDSDTKVVDGSYPLEKSEESDSRSVISTTESSEDENEIRKPILK